MSMNSHLAQLRKKHDALSEQVEIVQRSPSSSDHEIAALKKQKLQIKEEIRRIDTA